MSTVTTYRPTTLRSLRDALADGAGGRLVIAGAGTAADWGGAPEYDAVLDTTAMNGLISYNPTDMTVGVQAGMPFATLQETLAEHGQWVALDPARAGTVGGLVATADAGPVRHTFGALRDSVIGVTVVLADGTVARSGGHVIKNVAGYDLAKLFHGSLGTLGVLAEVILRVHPRAAATATLAVPCDAATAFDLGGRLIHGSLEPVAVEWCDGTLLARFDGTAGGVEDRLRRARVLAGPDATEAGDGVWVSVAELVRGVDGDTVVRLGTAPDRTPSLAGLVARAAAEHAVDAAMTSSPFAGAHTVRLRGGTAAAHAAVVTALRTEHPAATVCRWTDGLRAELPAWGEPPPAVAMLRAVKRAFDPDDRLGRGRLAPWF
ncbi:FAD-binding oxidoreductase [Jiangella sp. DSM 45060]|uniref:FAD-binding oxidoreductase n=1 Tax=Jiangella sp. DSM 45060 TaxID=1798224 RepID=UPI00087D54CB|nr:FAD-binding protein [Jiangella sp. DSM 45060]SDT67251.1 glycolate oxidase FAD binding subunit [Jiangella sp. DSM 45060]